MSYRSKCATVFYWLGVAMTVACLGLVLASNTKWGHRLDTADFPVSWVLAGIGLISFLVSEICRPRKKSDDQASQGSAKYKGAFEI
jgi:hypothetical protein